MSYSEKKKISIKKWAEEDRPREKLLHKGRASLTDSELIAILIGSGTKSLSAIDVAKLLLIEADNNLNELAKFTVKDYTKIRGIGEAKAINIISALELGRRRKDGESKKKTSIKSSKDIYEDMKANLLDLPHEEFWIVMLNRANMIIQKKCISSGGVSGTVADPKLIFKSALDSLASAIILVHNHPSGNLNPSEADKSLTIKLVSAGKILNIPVLDHIIFTNENYFSFNDHNLM